MGRDADLIEAAREGNFPACDKLLSGKPKKAGPFASLRRPNGGINSRDSSGYTALHYAALNGHRHIVELLLTYEASCNSADDKGSSPLHLASWAGDADIVNILLTHGPSIANVNLTNSDQETALHCACQHGHVEAVKCLLGHGADPNIKNKKDETALDLAALYGRTDTVQVLLELHPELVGPYTAYGGAMYSHTPLHLASRNGHKEIVEMILVKGFDINVRTARGTALHEAAVCGKSDVVKVLLQYNINVELRDQNNKTVLEVMDELKTPISADIIHIILNHIGVLRNRQASSGIRRQASPYDNVSMSHSMDSYSMEIEMSSSCASTSSTANSVNLLSVDGAAGGGGGSPSGLVLRPRSQRSIIGEDDDLSERRISAMSTTSGCSDCTTATLQGASIYSNDETVTPMAVGMDHDDDDNTSLSSSASLPSIHDAEPLGEVGNDDEEAEDENEKTNPKKNTTLTRDNDANVAMVRAVENKKVPPPTAPKPSLPAKPKLLRPPGLKPVKIPKVEEKSSAAKASPKAPARPSKPPRFGAKRTVSASPSHNQNQSQTTRASSCHETGDESGSSVYDSKGELGYSSCSRRRETDMRPRKNSGRGKGRKSTSSASESSHSNKESMSYETSSMYTRTLPSSRHSCDELMTRSLVEGQMNDEVGSRSSAEYQTKEQALDQPFISQRNFKRKIKQDCPSYATLGGRRKSQNGDLNNRKSFEAAEKESDEWKINMVSKTTYRLRSFSNDLNLKNSDEEGVDSEFELMEIPLSPTNYDQPPTPDHDPPSPYMAECEISKVIQALKKEINRSKRSVSTEIEQCYIESSARKRVFAPKVDKETTMNMEMVPRKSRRIVGLGDRSKSCNSSFTSALRPVFPRDETMDVEKDKDKVLSKSVEELDTASSVSDKRLSTGSEKSQQSLSILSPLDENEEWGKISKILDSFGSDIGNAVKESTTPNNSPEPEYRTWRRRDHESVIEWLRTLGLVRYKSIFIENGYDNLAFMGPDMIDELDLFDMGIEDREHIDTLKKAIEKNPMMEVSPKSQLTRLTVSDWLGTLGLSEYTESFSRNLFVDWERILNIWDDELTSILEVERVGHRKRILISVAGKDGLKDRIGKVRSDNEVVVSRPEHKRMPFDRDEAERFEDAADKERGAKRPEVSVRGAAVESAQANNTASPIQIDLHNLPPPGSPATTASTRSPLTSKSSIPPPTPPKPKKLITQSPGSQRRRAQTTSASTTLTTASSTSSTSAPVNSRPTSIDSGTATFGRRKKAAAPPPPTAVSKDAANASKGESSASSSSAFLSYKVKFFGKKAVKDFKGNDSTKLAIDAAKKAKKGSANSGKVRFLVLSERSVKVLRPDTKETVTEHGTNAICCVVRDNKDPSYFGYITIDPTNNNQRYSHVFTTDCVGKTSEILMVICEGFSAAMSKNKSFHQDSMDLLPTTIEKPTPQQRSTSTLTRNSSTTSSGRFRSDHLVSRMKLFFQGGSPNSESMSGVEAKKKAMTNKDQARRKRGGSVDNLLDDISDESNTMTRETKKKSLSSKNLSVGELEEVKITTV